jgi:hypothetical protein
VAKAWEEATENFVNGMCHKLWPECVQDLQGYKVIVLNVDHDRQVFDS